jgi:hypothetical protein
MNNHHLYTISSNGKCVGGFAPLSLDSIGAVEAPDSLSVPVENQIANLYPYMPWGNANDEPTKYDELIEKNTSLSGAILRKTEKIYAGGIEYGYLDKDRNFIPQFDETEELFLEEEATNQYIAGAISDLIRYNNAFPEVYFNALKTKVLGFRHINAGEIRLKLQNPETGKIDQTYQSKNWNRRLEIDKIIVRPVIDEIYDTIDKIREDQDNFRYTYKIFRPGPKTYYQTPIWYSSVLQKWYDQSMFIPEAISSFIKRLVFVQFQIVFREGYMQKLYGTRWEEGDSTAKLTMLQERLDDISTNLQNSENAGKFTAILSYTDANTGEEIKGYEIIPFESKIISTDFIDFMREADQHLIWSVGEDPIAMGQHGGGSDAGSGKKAAFNSDMATNQMIANAILAPFYFRKRFNGLPSNLKYRIKLPYLADMNQTSMDKRNNQYEDQKPAKTNDNDNKK